MLFLGVYHQLTAVKDGLNDQQLVVVLEVFYPQLTAVKDVLNDQHLAFVLGVLSYPQVTVVQDVLNNPKLTFLIIFKCLLFRMFLMILNCCT
jgi:hypothetical protein